MHHNDASRSDYQDYQVSKDDEPLLRAGEVASLLGVSTATVRRMIERGQLPARRLDVVYNRPFQVPRWAVEKRRGTPHGVIPSAGTGLRERYLEDAVAALQEAQDHHERAAELQSQAQDELRRANTVLREALARRLVPDGPGYLE